MQSATTDTGPAPVGSAAARPETPRSAEPVALSPAHLWGVDVGDLLGHIPLPAKITIQVLEPIDLGNCFGPHPELALTHRVVTRRMQRTFDELAAERRWLIIG